MSTPGERLKQLLTPERPDMAEVAAFLDGLSHAGRVEATRSLQGPALQRKLWEGAASGPAITTADLVPPDYGSLREVVFHGKNSLPVFTEFQKRFCRPSVGRGDGEDVLWGYNHQQLGWLIGPGYFVVHAEGQAPAAIDYRCVPPEHPAAWPAVRPNEQGLSRLVYMNMVDYLRRVSHDVLIGSAWKKGKPLDSYFLLCREL
ncbi:MAG: hypothetical protein KIT14_20740 [bacterium]|nr:hypothetical protein [bacterium]